MEATSTSLLSVDALLEHVVELGASDLHITAGSPPIVRVHGGLVPLEGFPVLSPETTRDLLYRVLTTEKQKHLEIDRQIDLSYGVPGLARFRLNVYLQRDSVAAAFRVIPASLKTLEELGLPASLSTLAHKPRGLVLVTGPTGSGKSTTLAAMVDEINRTRNDHIITIEDPIEFLHRHKRCIVNQREIGTDATSFSEALRAALRQDPDVILLGEMRDLETISTAITAAETGHLVFATLHTQTRSEHRRPHHRRLPGIAAGSGAHPACGHDPGDRHTDADSQLATAASRVAALEILFPDDAVRNLIRQGKTEQIYSYMQTGTKRGMQTMEQALADYVLRTVITREEALSRSTRQDQLAGMLDRRQAPTVSGLRVAGS